MPDQLDKESRDGGSRSKEYEGISAFTGVGRCFALIAALSVLLTLVTPEARAAPTEYQVKAAFVLNFSRFVAWPAQAFSSTSHPFVIGVLGDDPLGPQLDEAVRGEQADGHPLVVRRFQNIAEVGDCQILFIDQSKSAQLPQILASLRHRSTLTVADLEGASERGVMIQFATVDHRIRLRINADSARAAGLNISATLLRLAQIDRTVRD